jgi:hypothetical protein
MDREEIVAALRALGERLERRGVQGDLYLVGGAAMALAYDARRTTRDVDAVFEPKMVVYEVAAEVAEERGLPLDWLNDSAKGHLHSEDPHDGPVFEFPGLRVQAASPQMLLAMKVVAARVGEDDDDVAWLADHLGLGTAGAVIDEVTAIVGQGRLTPRSRFFVEEVVGDAGRSG